MYNKVMYTIGKFIGWLLVVGVFIWVAALIALPIIVLVWFITK